MATPLCARLNESLPSGSALRDDNAASLLASVKTVHCVLGVPSVPSSDGEEERLAGQLMVSEYGREDLIDECREACEQLGKKFVLHKIALTDLPALFSGLASQPAWANGEEIALNLCDGTETDGFPGPSVVRELASKRVAFTGANEAFYAISTSKLAMKYLFDAKSVSTAPWVELPAVEDASSPAWLSTLRAAEGKYPLLVKPDVSYNSCGLSDTSIVYDGAQLYEQACRVGREFGRIFAERFIRGREFTALVCGDREEGVRVFQVSERVFDSELKWNERFLTLDRLWGTGRPENAKDEWWYAEAPPEWQEELQELSRRAFLAVAGSGYARVDIRRDDHTHQFYVLEVNANCGVTGYPGTSMGSILEYSRLSLPRLAGGMVYFLAHARARHLRQRGASAKAAPSLSHYHLLTDEENEGEKRRWEAAASSSLLPQAQQSSRRASASASAARSSVLVAVAAAFIHVAASALRTFRWLEKQ